MRRLFIILLFLPLIALPQDKKYVCGYIGDSPEFQHIDGGTWCSCENESDFWEHSISGDSIPEMLEYWNASCKLPKNPSEAQLKKGARWQSVVYESSFGNLDTETFVDYRTRCEYGGLKRVNNVLTPWESSSGFQFRCHKKFNLTSLINSRVDNIVDIKFY